MSEQNRKVLLEARDIYGIRKFYPANKEAELFLRLGNTKTISKQWFPVIRELGFDIELKQEVL